MASTLDVLVATTLAHTTRTFSTQARGSAAGLAFEQALYQAVTHAQHWSYITPPDQFDLGLPIHTRTGVSYEHDGMVANNQALYILEAKWHGSQISREHVGIVVQKLFDTLLGSYREIGHLAVKSVMAVGKGGAEMAAIHYAIAYGILLIIPGRPTPFEILQRLLDGQPLTISAQNDLRRDCETLANLLWRPVGTLLYPHGDDGTFILDANHIYNANRTTEILAFWNECIHRAEALHVLFPHSEAAHDG